MKTNFCFDFFQSVYRNHGQIKISKSFCFRAEFVVVYVVVKV